MPKISPNPPTVRGLSSEESERLLRFYPGLQRSLAGCPTCGGTGTFLWRDLDAEDPLTAAPVEWECDCVEQFKLGRFLLNSGIDRGHQRQSWVDAVSVPAEARAVVDDYRDHSLAFVNSGHGMILEGPTGTGKTLMSSLLAKNLLALGFDVYFITFAGLIDKYAAGWKNSEDKYWFEERIQNAGVLVIDDIGREQKTRMDLSESILDRVIRARVAGARSTLITTNLALEDIDKVYSKNVFSLLEEVSIHQVVTGPDYRREFNGITQQIARAGMSRPIVLY